MPGSAYLGLIAPGQYGGLPSPPSAPASPSPIHGASGVVATPTLMWSAIGATSYDVYFGTNPSPPIVVSGQIGSTYAPGLLSELTQHYWKIVAINALGSTTGPIWTFTTRRTTALVMTINGVTPHMRVSGLSIRDLLNDAPNTCSFTVDTTPPVVGQDVKIGLGGLDVVDRLFAGTVDNVEQIYEGRPVHRAWRVTCVDYTNSLNRRKVRKRYAQQSASLVALDLIATYTTGFTTAGIVPGLPTVEGGIDYTEEDVGTAMTRLAARIGAYWYVDYGKDIHLFLTEVTAEPDPLEAGYEFLDSPAISRSVDLTQVRTRVWVEGGGSQARILIDVGSTTLQVTDGSWYPPGGGWVVSGPQRIAYTGKGAAGGPAAPSGTSSLVVGNLGPGPYSYKYSQIDAGIETPLSAASAAISIAAVTDPTGSVTAANGSFTAPGSAPTVGARTAGTGPDPGNHEYAVTFQTATGETTPGPRSSVVTTGLVSAPSVAPAPDLNGTGNLTLGTYGYKVTFVNAAGETTPSAAGSYTVALVPEGGVGSGLAGTTGGSMSTGKMYGYHIAYTTAAGETTPGLAGQITLSGADNAVALTSLSVSSDIRVTGKKLYRTDYTIGGTRLITSMSNATTSYTDTMSDATWTGQPTALVTDTASTGQIIVNNIQVSGDATVTARKIYRTVAGGSTYKLVGTIANNTSISVTDNVADGSLGADAPSSNTATAQVVPLSAIPTGPGGTTGRRVYRTTAASPTGTLFLVTTISNNTTTTFSDTVADGSLGAAAPTVNTAGGSLGAGVYGWRVTFQTAQGETLANTAGTATISSGSGALSVIPTSADARVTARRIYRTTVGGSTYLYEATIGDNSTTTFNSTAADGALGAAYSGVNTTAGGGKISLTGIATGGGGVTARKLYRTVTGGSTYKLVTTIANNTDTTYLDNIADGSLGAVAPGDTITQLTGIPASGPGSILYEIRAGDDVNLLVQCDDTAAQTALAALDGSDGIVEHFIQDRRVSEGEARAIGEADLALFAYPLITIRYATRDPKTRSGKTIHVDLPTLDIDGDFTIQSVTIDQIDIAKGLYPRYTVEASSTRFSFEDVLRRLRLVEG